MTYGKGKTTGAVNKSVVARDWWREKWQTVKGTYEGNFRVLYVVCIALQRWIHDIMPLSKPTDMCISKNELGYMQSKF